jgi:lysophospholipase L1-like esterase
LRGRILIIIFGWVALTGVSRAEGAQVPEKHSLYWQQRVDHFRALPDTPGEIIFLGDSITDGCNWSELFSRIQIKNRGISGDTTQGVLDRLDEVLSSRPAKIFLMIGINDLGRGLSETAILANIKSLLKDIRQKSPETEVFIQSVLPVNDRFSVFPSYMDKTARVLSVNKVLRRMAEDYGFRYIDLFSALSDGNNRLSDKYTNDGLHLNGAGYACWKKTIEKLIGS